MKRILYLTFYFRPDLCAGSFRNSPLVDELAKQIQDMDIQVDVLTTSPNRYSTFREDYKKHEQIGNLSIERIVVPSHESGVKDQIFSFKTYFFEVLKRTRNQEYDLVFASSSRFFTSYLGYIIAKRKQIPLYLDVRDIFSETVASISQNPLITHLLVPFLEKQENKVYKYANHINLISKGFKENFNRKQSTNYSFFTHGVDPAFIDNQTDENQTKKEGLKKIVYAGNIGHSQGLYKIIPGAAKALENRYLFRVIGDGGEKDKLKNLLEQKQVTNVQLVDPISREEIIDEYKDADILFIHLNDLSVFEKVVPSKIFELAAVEKPILAGVNGYPREFLEKHVNGSFIFDSGDVPGLLNKIDDIEKFGFANKNIDNSYFTEKYDRQKIKREMVTSILSYI